MLRLASLAGINSRRRHPYKKMKVFGVKANSICLIHNDGMNVLKNAQLSRGRKDIYLEIFYSGLVWLPGAKFSG